MKCVLIIPKQIQQWSKYKDWSKYTLHSFPRKNSTFV